MILQVHSSSWELGQGPRASFKESHIWRCSWHTPVLGSGPRSTERGPDTEAAAPEPARNSPNREDEEVQMGNRSSVSSPRPGSWKQQSLAPSWAADLLNWPPEIELQTLLELRPSLPGASRDDLNTELWGSTAQGQHMIDGYRMSQAGQTQRDLIALILSHRTIYCYLM